MQTRYHCDLQPRIFPNFHSRHIRRCMNPGSFRACSGQCVYCTDKALTFLGSAYPLLPFDINIDLVQTRYHCDLHPRIFPNFHSRNIRRCMNPCSFRACSGQCVYCTVKAITFIASTYPKLPFHVNIALVKTRFHCDLQPRIFPNVHSRHIQRCMNPGSFRACCGQCVYCTDKAITF